VVRFDERIRDQFPGKSSDFDDFERCVGAWKGRFREKEKVADGEQALWRKVGHMSARRLIALQPPT
jgi:hypothetical protein